MRADLLALILAMSTGCAAAGLRVEDWAPATGALLEASPASTYVAASWFVVFREDPLAAPGRAPVIQVIERASGRVVSTVRGHLVGGPDDSGAVLYVAGGALRSSRRAAPLLVLPPEVSASDGVWSGFRIAADRLVLFHIGAQGRWTGSINLSPPRLTTSRAEQRAVVAEVASTAHGAYVVKVGDDRVGYFAAIDATTLDERWRTPGGTGDRLHGDRADALGITGDGATIVARSEDGVRLLDARTGKPLGELELDDGTFGSSVPWVRFAPVPGRAAVVALRWFPTEGPAHELTTAYYDVVWIDVASRRTALLRSRRGEQPPDDIAVGPDVVLLAPYLPPLSLDQPDRWPPAVRAAVEADGIGAAARGAGR